jgi:hypothetical protein
VGERPTPLVKLERKRGCGPRWRLMIPLRPKGLWALLPRVERRSTLPHLVALTSARNPRIILS